MCGFLGEGAVGGLDGRGSASSHIWWWLVFSPSPGTENVQHMCVSAAQRQSELVALMLLCVCACATIVTALLLSSGFGENQATMFVVALLR